MTSRTHPPPSRLAVAARFVALVAVAVLLSGIIVDGDLLVFPAVMLVVGTWLAIALVVLGHRLATTVLPPLGLTARRAGTGAWRAVDDDPVGQRLHAWARSLQRRLAPLHRRAEWTAHRVGPGPTGAALTAGVGCAAAGATALVWIGTQADRSTSALSQFDLRVANATTRLEVTGERKVMLALTNLGATRTVVLIIAILTVAALAARAARAVGLLLATSVTSSVLVTALKATHARPRPALGQLVEHSTSFPSGHAAGSLALAFGIVLLWRAAALPRSSIVAAIVVPAGLLVGYSRAYLTIHWMSDVVAGWLCAALAAVIVVTAGRLVHHQPRRRELRRWPIAAGAAVALALAVPLGITGAHRQLPDPPATTPEAVPADNIAALVAQVPRYSETLLGQPMEPVSILVVASEQHLRDAVGDGRWTVADRNTPRRALRTYLAGTLGQDDPAAPVTPTFLDTRLQDLAIEQPRSGAGVRSRHHARLWQLPLVTSDGCPVWAVTASLDDRVEWTLRTIFPNHHIAPDIDTERAHVLETLTASGVLDNFGTRPFVGPTLGTNAAGDHFFTDGNIAVLRQDEPCP